MSHETKGAVTGTYNITVKGEVQDVGFRDFVENVGRAQGLPGYVYNAEDGTAKIVTRGHPSDIDDFVEGIRKQDGSHEATVDDIKQEEIDGDPNLPSELTKIPTDDLSDIGRKLDKGIGIMSEMRNDTEDLVEGQDKLIELLDERLYSIL